MALILRWLLSDLWRTAALALLLLCGVELVAGKVLLHQRDKARAEFAAHLSADRVAEAVAQERARAKEEHDRQAFARAGEQFEKDKADAIAKERAVADGLRRGALRLRREWTCPAGDSAATAGSAEVADAGAELRGTLAAAVVRVGAEADAQVKGLQDLLRAERDRPIQP